MVKFRVLFAMTSGIVYIKCSMNYFIVATCTQKISVILEHETLQGTFVVCKRKFYGQLRIL